jgi:hypothetical protein
MSSRFSESGTLRAVPFFDQGLFLLHLNRGKEEMRNGHFEEAHRELDEARRFRRDDSEVLANLAFTLFHLGQYDEAEQVTREVLASHPGSVPLLFNLGLILFKSGKTEAAKEPFEKILSTVPGHRKAHLTLGLVSQKLGDLSKARYHLRMAGAERRAGGDGDDTVARAARVATSSSKPREELRDGEEAQTSPIVKPEQFETEATVPPTPPVPASALESAPSTSTTPIPLSVLKPRGESANPPQAVRVSRSDGVVPEALGPFAPVPGGFLRADARGGLLVRRTAIAGRRGSPNLEAEKSIAGPFARTLVRATGEGTLLLLDRGRRAFLTGLTEEFLSVDPARLLAFESSLAWREDPAFELRRQVSVAFMKLFGNGAVALAVASEPARFEVTPSDPLVVALSAVVAYGGDAQPELIEGADPIFEAYAGPLFRFSGTGTVWAEGG